MSDPIDENPETVQLLKFVPTLDYYERTYGRNCEGNDQKAVNIFRNFETKEKLRRLQMELLWIKEGRVAEQVCERVIGKKRRARHGSYLHWAELMLLWLVTKR